MAESSENESWSGQGLTPFKTLRKRVGISLDEIKAQTLFSESKLTALDEMRFDDLGSTTFAIAYIQKYAKIVGFDPSRYIDQYKQECHESGKQVEETDTGLAQEPSYRPTRVKKTGNNPLNKLQFAHYVMIAAVVWVLVMIFQPSNNTSIAAAQSFENHEPQNVSEKLAESSVEEAAYAEPNLSTELPEINAALDEKVTGELQYEAINGSSQNEQVALASNRSDNLDVSPAENALTLSDSQQDVLIFSFTDECWVKVSDVTGKVIFAKTSNKGDNLQLLGQGPFEVMLGNARAASLFVNGDPYPITPHLSRRTLKFLVTP